MSKTLSSTTEKKVATGSTWTIDASHTLVEFAVKHLMITTVKGRFTEFGGKIVTDPARPNAAEVDVSINVASLSTGDEKRDAHLRSGDFFGSEEWPAMRFTGKRIEGDTSRRFTLHGDLTIRDVTQEVALDVTSTGRRSDPWGNEKLAFTATAKVNRLDYGLKWNVALEAGGVLVGEEVKIEIEAQLVRQG